MVDSGKDHSVDRHVKVAGNGKVSTALTHVNSTTGLFLFEPLRTIARISIKTGLRTNFDYFKARLSQHISSVMLSSGPPATNYFQRLIHSIWSPETQGIDIDLRSPRFVC